MTVIEEVEAPDNTGSLVYAILQKSWLSANFMIPANFQIRREETERLRTLSRMGIMLLPENRDALIELRARIEALDAYETAQFQARAKKRKKK